MESLSKDEERLVRHLRECAVHKVDRAPEDDGAQGRAVKLVVEEVLDVGMAALDVQELVTIIEHQVLLRLSRSIHAVVVHQCLDIGHMLVINVHFIIFISTCRVKGDEVYVEQRSSGPEVSPLEL